QPRPRALGWKPGSQDALLGQGAGRDEHAARVALELIWRHRGHFSPAQLERAVRAGAGRPDRGLRQASARLLAGLDAREQERVGKLLVTPLERTTRWLAKPSL